MPACRKFAPYTLSVLQPRDTRCGRRAGPFPLSQSCACIRLRFVLNCQLASDCCGGAPVSLLTNTSSTVRLGGGRRGLRGHVAGLSPVDVSGINRDELERRLIEMGFIEGARIELLHEGPFGRDPIAVRVDDTTVALRRRDANLVIVTVQEG